MTTQLTSTLDRTGESWQFGLTAVNVLRPAIIVEGDKFNYHPDYMLSGKYYEFRFLDRTWLAIKSDDDKVNFFYLPDTKD